MAGRKREDWEEEPRERKRARVSRTSDEAEGASRTSDEGEGKQEKKVAAREPDQPPQEQVEFETQVGILEALFGKAVEKVKEHPEWKNNMSAEDIERVKAEEREALRQGKIYRMTCAAQLDLEKMQCDAPDATLNAEEISLRFQSVAGNIAPLTAVARYLGTAITLPIRVKVDPVTHQVLGPISTARDSGEHRKPFFSAKAFPVVDKSVPKCMIPILQDYVNPVSVVQFMARHTRDLDVDIDWSACLRPEGGSYVSLEEHNYKVAMRQMDKTHPELVKDAYLESGSGEGHINILLVDNAAKTVEYYEPRFDRTDEGEMQLVRSSVALFGSWVAATFPGYRFLPSEEVCPEMGPQTKEASGTCYLWSLFYIYYRSSCPREPTKADQLEQVIASRNRLSSSSSSSAAAAGSLVNLVSAPSASEMKAAFEALVGKQRFAKDVGLLIRNSQSWLKGFIKRFGCFVTQITKAYSLDFLKYVQRVMSSYLEHVEKLVLADAAVGVIGEEAAADLMHQVRQWQVELLQAESAMEPDVFFGLVISNPYWRAAWQWKQNQTDDPRSKAEIEKLRKRAEQMTSVYAPKAPATTDPEYAVKVSNWTKATELAAIMANLKTRHPLVWRQLVDSNQGPNLHLFRIFVGMHEIPVTFSEKRTAFDDLLQMGKAIAAYSATV